MCYECNLKADGLVLEGYFDYNRGNNIHNTSICTPLFSSRPFLDNHIHSYIIATAFVITYRTAQNFDGGKY